MHVYTARMEVWVCVRSDDHVSCGVRGNAEFRASVRRRYVTMRFDLNIWINPHQYLGSAACGGGYGGEQVELALCIDHDEAGSILDASFEQPARLIIAMYDEL
jgi:hypothetical protein